METAARLREARDRAVADAALLGSDFGRVIAAACDDALSATASDVSLPGRWALLAVGSYARREICPGSDVDVVFVHDGRTRGGAVEAAARSLWYPFWDAGFILGNSTRTPKEQLSLAADDLDALTSLLDARFVAGDDAFAADLVDRVRELGFKRRAAWIDALAAGARARSVRPGAIAEMLEPNLKDGGGGIRDVQALGWAGWILRGPGSSKRPVGPGGIPQLVADGIITDSDALALDAARERLLRARVALQRPTGGRSDQLALQDQDAVAVALDVGDADDLVRGLSAAARRVGWITDDAWRRLVLAVRPGRGARRPEPARELGGGIVVRDGYATFADGGDEVATLESLLRLAASAAVVGVPITRAALVGPTAPDALEWDDASRRDLMRLLRAGRGAVPVFEALDQAGVLERIIPEWAEVRARPQRNAYHRFTVDRHLLEAVAETVEILDDEGFDGDVARRGRLELLLLGALLHDIGKGSPGDHATVGAVIAGRVAERIGVDAHGVEVLQWLVRNHLLLADTATRRDLSDEDTIVRFGRAVGDTERLDLLYALTVGDSRATGPAAWSTAKSVLCRQLFIETDALLERGVVGPGLDADRRRVMAVHRELLDAGELAVEWREEPDGRIECVVVARDRRGLLATVAGVLTIAGFDVDSASIYGDVETGMALEVYRGTDRYGRFDEAGRRDFVTMLRSALDGALPWRDRLAERIRRYRGAPAPNVTRAFDVSVHLDASASATVVEVHAPDSVGLLATVAGVFSDLGFDVSAALASTNGTQVVDVFYIRDEHGAKPTSPLRLAQLRATVLARLTSVYLLP